MAVKRLSKQERKQVKQHRSIRQSRRTLWDSEAPKNDQEAHRYA